MSDFQHPLENNDHEPAEVTEVVGRYARRNLLDGSVYSPLAPDVYMMQQEKERALIKLFKTMGLTPLNNKRLLEVGCGSGTNLHLLLRLGFSPENLVGNDLLEERIAAAKKKLPAGIKLIAGDAVKLDLPAHSFDIVSQSTVFSSILDDKFQQELANKMWSWVKPGGGILWYDFTYNNPANPDVRGVTERRIKELFPQGLLHGWRVTLAPPISRRVTKIHPFLYQVFNMLPLLRTHVVCWIKK